MIDETFDRDLVRAVEERWLLWAFLPFEQAYNTITSAARMLDPLDRVVIDEDELREEWETANDAIRELPEPIDNPTIKELPEKAEIKAHVEELVQMEFFRQSYGELRDDLYFGLIPINSVIALQASVSISAHVDIQESLQDTLSLIKYVFPTEREQGYFTQTIQTSNNELVGVQLTSRAPNVNVRDVRMLDGEQPMEKRVLFTVRAPPNLVNCYLHEGRVYLNNGYHRAYQLLEAGETHLPAIIRELDEFPPDTKDMPKDVVQSDRPPLLADFNSDAATRYRLPATNELIRITAESTTVFR